VGIESDAQKDLTLDDSDAENVVGGAKKKKKAKAKATHKAAAAAGPRMIVVPVTGTPVESAPVPDDCDPGDPAAVAQVDEAAPAGG